MKFKTLACLAFAQVLACGASYASPAGESAIDFGIEDKTDAYVLETVTPQYPLEMLERGVQGRTLLKLRVDEGGEVCGVTVVASTNPAFSEAAVKSVSKWYFQPGTIDGRAVPQTVVVPVNFVIEDLNTPSLASL